MARDARSPQPLGLRLGAVCVGLATAACPPPRMRGDVVTVDDAALLEAGDALDAQPLDSAPATPDEGPENRVAPADEMLTVETGTPPVIDASPEAASDVATEPPCEMPGLRRCGGRCVDLASDNMNCGICGASCTAGAHSSSTCNAGECEPMCERGYADCDGTPTTGCETDLTTIEHCGSCTRVCTGGQVCSDGACVGAEMAPPPRQFSPLSGVRIAKRRPDLVWLPASGAAGTQVQVCRSRLCNDLIVSLDSTGNRVTLPMDLAPGVYYWRARSGAPGAYSTRFSPVWQFRVGVRSGASNGYWGVDPDFNGDGFSDIAVGAPGVGAPAGMSLGVGEVTVYYGAATGPPTTPSWRFRGVDGYSYSRFSADLTAAGDMNGDGFVDLLVAGPDVTFFSGRGYVFLGGPAGLASEPAFALTAPMGLGHMGESVTSVGDVNGDGLADVALGAPDQPEGAAGSVLVFAGVRGGMITAPLQVLRPPTTGDTAVHLGRSVAMPGDVNGDGLPEVLIATEPEGTRASAIFAYSGSGTSIAAVPASRITVGADVFAWLAPAGDANGDGFADIAVGIPEFDRNNGALRLHLGSSGGLLPTHAFEFRGADGARCGSAVAGGGDLNGDGFDDVALSCGSERRMRVFDGTASGLRANTVVLEDAVGAALSTFNGQVAFVGDVNNDGYDDLAVGLPERNSDRGRVHLYFGGATGVSRRPAWTAEGTAAGDHFGYAIARR